MGNTICNYILYMKQPPSMTMPVAKSMHEVRKGPQPVLTHDEEQALEDWLVENGEYWLWQDKTAAIALSEGNPTDRKNGNVKC